MFAADHSLLTSQADRDVRADHVPRHEDQFPYRRSECVRGRLPLLEALLDELSPFLLASAVQHLEVGGIGSKVDAGRPGVQRGVAIRPCRPVPGGAVGGLHPDLAGALELRGIRVPRALALPEVEDAGWIPALLRSLAPVAGRQGAVLLPGPAGHIQATVAVPRDAQEAHCRRLALAPRGQRELPPQPLDQVPASLGLDRLAELAVDRADLRRCSGRVVTYGGQPE